MNLKWIEGYEGLYKVSDKGDVISYKRYKEGKPMSPKKDKEGYLEVGLRDKDYKRKFFRVHRLVAKAFISNPDNLPEINHKDRVTSNNEVTNLEWCDKSYNNKHRLVDFKGEKQSQSKLTNEEVLIIYELAWEGNLTQKEIAKLFKVSRGAISGIKYGATWSHITKHRRNA